MKIFFSTLFDSASYPLNIFMENGIAIGAMHLGPAGLLHFLELHLGIPAPRHTPFNESFNIAAFFKKTKKIVFTKNLLKPMPSIQRQPYFNGAMN